MSSYHQTYRGCNPTWCLSKIEAREPCPHTNFCVLPLCPYFPKPEKEKEKENKALTDFKESRNVHPSA